MSLTVSAAAAKKDFAHVLETLTETREHVVVEEAGRPVAVVVTPEEFRALRRERAWAMVRQVQERNADRDPDEVLREVTAIVEEVRQEHYERDRAAAGGS